MKPKQTCIIVLLTALSLQGVALDNYLVGARALGLSHAFVSFSDTWSTFHNQAGLAGLANFSSGFFYESKFNVDELSLLAGSVVFPSKTGTFGLGFSQFGSGTYKEQKVGLAFAKRLSKNWRAGIQVNYFMQAFPENKRSRGFATFEGGIIWSPNNRLFLGSHIFNPVRAGLKTNFGTVSMPVIFRTGGHYQFSKTVLLTAEVQKSTNRTALLKTGIEFSPVNNLAIRIGVSGKNINYTAGIGYKTGKISTDFGFSYHGNLGITPSVSVQFAL